MTVEEMHNAVKMELDKTSSLELPSFETEEIDYWLNQGIDTFIKQRYDRLNAKKTSFEETEKRINDLRTLVSEPTSLGSTTCSYTNGYAFTLPSDYMLSVSKEARINFISVATGESTIINVPCKETKADNYTIKLLRDPHSEHNLYLDYAKPLTFTRDSKINVITDGNYTVTNLYLTYIKTPTTVDYDTSTDCDLPDHTHLEIIKITVSKMLENIESPRYVPFNTEVLKME